MQSPEEPLRQRRVAIALGALIAIVFVGLGLWAIVDGHFTGHTKQGRVVTIDGDAARWMGAVLVCIGMLTLSLAMPSKRAVLRWALLWVALGLASGVMLLRPH